MKCNRRPVRWMIAAAVLGISTTAAIAEDATVKFDEAKVRTGKAAAFDTVTTLKKGDKVQVLAREGAWIKVQASGKQGWIGANSLGDAKGKSLLAGIGEAASGAAGSSSGSTSAAGKGAGESERWAQSNNLNRSGLERMLALRNTVNGSEFEKFTTEGNVGPGKK